MDSVARIGDSKKSGTVITGSISNNGANFAAGLQRKHWRQIPPRRAQPGNWRRQLIELADVFAHSATAPYFEYFSESGPAQRIGGPVTNVTSPLTTLLHRRSRLTVYRSAPQQRPITLRVNIGRAL